MAMKDVGHAQDFGRLKHGAAVESKALRIVRIVASGGAIEGIAIEERRVVNEIELHPGAFSTIQHGAEPVLIVKRDGNAGKQQPGIRKPGLFIFGKIDGDGVAQLGERLRERAHNVSQSAGFSERHAFRRGKDDVHGASVRRTDERNPGKTRLSRKF
jgi:hypothetical protein